MSTSTITLPSPTPSLLATLAAMGARRLTVSDYHKMHDAGILMETERCELLDGFIVEKPVKKPPHEGVIRRLTVRLSRYAPPGWMLQIQDSISLPPDSEPEPDAAMVRGDETSYDDHHPGPADIGIVIEAADTSVRFDRREKVMIYARHELPVYWLINLVDQVIEVYTDPDPTTIPPSYRTRTDYRPGQSVPIVLDGAVTGQIPVTDLLP